MVLSFIFLDNCSFMGNLPIALALCLLPFILGWLASTIFNKVGWLKTRVAELTSDNSGLTTKVNSLHEETTDLRVKITQLESSLEDKEGHIRKLRSDLMICEGERNVLKSKSTGGGAVKAAAAATVMFLGTKYKSDDLKIVEGIGPKIEQLMHDAGITTWRGLSQTNVSAIQEILTAAGSRFALADPATWPKQAELAADGKWDELQEYQDFLNAGKEK